MGEKSCYKITIRRSSKKKKGFKNRKLNVLNNVNVRSLNERYLDEFVHYDFTNFKYHNDTLYNTKFFNELKRILNSPDNFNKEKTVTKKRIQKKVDNLFFIVDHYKTLYKKIQH